MRFVNFIAALATIAGITRALQDIGARDIDNPSTDTTSFVARRAPLALAQPAKQHAQESHSKPSSHIKEPQPAKHSKPSSRVKKPQPAKHSKPSSHVKKPQPAKHSKPSSHINVCNNKKPPHKLRFMPRGDADLVGYDETSIWYVYEGGFLAAGRVPVGQYSRVFDVSGCSAAFFFDAAGHASSAHITAGNEKAEAKEAAEQAKEAGTTDSVVIYAPTNSKSETIKTAIRGVLPDITVVMKTYNLNTHNRNERWQFTYKAGDTTKKVKVETYTC
ncbi:hypothetical protein G7Y89_g8706 [Cudoniella acicularis]|uniref:Uncharacterized protein n=1 Tax=Cudoniella acicularis TaxID=354080 RepID=A0A8H4RH06_9HELO|nr:hypothetical protein G7Y89_g8706 [Cudoniella acicularis]